MVVRSSTNQELLSSGFSHDGAEARIDFDNGSTEPVIARKVLAAARSSAQWAKD
jgi:hypothetical protein